MLAFYLHDLEVKFRAWKWVLILIWFLGTSSSLFEADSTCFAKHLKF